MTTCTSPSARLAYVSDDRPPNVHFCTAIERPFGEDMLLDGRLEPGISAELIAPYSGMLSWSRAYPGYHTDSHQRLFCLDSMAAWRALKKVRLRYELAAMEFESAALGYSRNGKFTLSDTVNKSLSYSTGLEAARIDLEEARRQVASAWVEAPIKGVITEVSATANHYIQAGSVMAKVYDPGWFLIRGHALETRWEKIRPGDTLQVMDLNGRETGGYVLTVSPGIDADGFFEVTGRVEGQTGWVPGMHLTMKVHIATHSAICISPEAVFEREGRAAVFKYTRGRVEWRYVQTGEMTQDAVEILKGLSAGDSVITDHQLELDHGMRVELF